MTLPDEGGSLADAVRLLEAERDALLAEARELRVQQVEVGRKLYRRGYLTGYMAGKQRRARESAPERHARGWAGGMLR